MKWGYLNYHKDLESFTFGRTHIWFSLIAFLKNRIGALQEWAGVAAMHCL